MAQSPTQSLLSSFFESLSAHPQSALVLDYDGTLAPFRENRFEAVPYPGVREVLHDILDSGFTRLVLLSGRSPHEVRDLLALSPAPEIWGVHGQHRLWPGGRLDIASVNPATVSALQNAMQWLNQHGYKHLVEDKTGSIAVHFRGISAHEARAAQAAIRAEWDRLAPAARMAVLQFDGGIELRPTEPHKGTAVTALRDELEPGTPLAYLGDDTTDEDAFRALRGTGALTLLVRPEFRPTDAEAWIRPPEQLLDFLHQWSARTTGRAQ